MNKRVDIPLLLLLIGVIIVSSGCKKEDVILPSQVSFLADDMGLMPFEKYTIGADANDNIYAIQATDENDEFKLFFHPNGTSSWEVSTFAFAAQDPYYITDGNHLKSTSDGSIWLLGAEELIEFRGAEIVRRYSVSHLIESGQEVGVSRFATFHNEVWLLHWNYGLFKLNRETGETIAFPQPGWTGANMLMTIDSKGNKWITKRNYERNVIALKNDGSWFTASDPDSLIGCPECPNWGGSAHQDFGGIVADDAGLVYLYSGSINRLYQITNGNISSMVFNLGSYYDGFSIDKENHMWFYRTLEFPSLLPQSILFRYNGGILEESIELTDFFNGNVWPYDMCFDKRGNQWVATNMGVAVYNENGVTF